MALDNSDNQNNEPADRVSGDIGSAGSNGLRLESFSLLQSTARPAATPEATVCIPTLQVGDARLNMCNEYSVNSNVARLVERNQDSVVKINTLDSATASEGLGSTGTGFFVTSDGLIATGYHVIKDAVDIRVRTNDGRQYSATIRQIDIARDQAVLQIRPNLPNERFQPVELASSSRDVGRSTQLVALGFPNNQNRMYVSEAQYQRRQPLRNIPVNGGFFENEDRNREVITTRAHVNHGNSGGPVFDAATGRVVGMVNLSNQVDTHINPIEDLQQFVASIQPASDMRYAATPPSPRPSSFDSLAGALLLTGRNSLSAQLTTLQSGRALVLDVRGELPRVPQTNPNPYSPAPAVSFGTTRSLSTMLEDLRKPKR